MPSINPDTPITISISQKNYLELKAVLSVFCFENWGSEESKVVFDFLDLMYLSFDRDVVSPCFIALQAEATKDEDDEPVEMLPTTRELKEVSSQVEAN